MNYLENLKAIASRIAEAGYNGATAYRPSEDEVVSLHEIESIMENVRANWERRQEVTEHSIRYDVNEDRYVMNVITKGSSARSMIPDSRTASLIRRY